MGSVKQNSKILGMMALASVFLVTSTSFDRAFAQDSADGVLNGTVNSITPPPPKPSQKRSLKLRKKAAKPAPESVVSDSSDKAATDAPVADAPTQQKSVPAPAMAKKPEAAPKPAAAIVAPKPSAATTTAATSKPAATAAAPAPVTAAVPLPVAVVRTAPPSIAAVEKPAASTQAQVPRQLKSPEASVQKSTNAPAPSFVNIPNLANPSPAVPLPLARPPEFPRAALASTPKVSSKSLRNGDSTGAADDEEREMYKSGALKASNAEELPESGNDLYTVKNERPLLSPGKTANVIGNVKAGDKFEVVLPGERFARVRFRDGRIGFIDNKAIVPSEPMPAIQPAKAASLAHKPITVLPPSKPAELQAECVKCALAQVDNPQAIDRRKTRPIADITKRLNRKNRLAGLADSSDEPSSGSTSLHGIRTPSADYARRMRAAAMREAVAPRVPATWMRPKLGYGKVGGNRSKGSCYSAVKDVLVDMHLAKSHYSDELAMSAHKKGFLKRMGLVNILPDMKSKLGGSLQDLAWKAPVGAILVYDQGKAGHIEVKAENKLFCSDFCSTHPVNTKLARRLIAVYVP